MEEVTAAKLDEIKAAAKKATPGPWHPGVAERHYVFDPHGFIVAEGLSVPSLDDRSLAQRATDQTAYIALCDPATVLWLVQRARQLHAVQALVNCQAEDDGLWFMAHTAAEGYLQQELRKLHAAIEGKP